MTFKFISPTANILYAIFRSDFFAASDARPVCYCYGVVSLPLGRSVGDRKVNGYLPSLLHNHSQESANCLCVKCLPGTAIPLVASANISAVR